MFPLSHKIVYRKTKKPKNKGLGRIDRYAAKIQKDLPSSEIWFQTKWKRDLKQNRLPLFQDKFNSAYLRRYIPDVLNIGLKYVIEIDGSVHDDEIIQFKDKLKDSFYTKKGYKIFRIKAYDELAYQKVLTEVQHMTRLY